MFGISEDAFVCVTIGRLVARKATAQLVDALADSALPDAHLLVVGDGPDREAIERRAQERGIADRIHLLGQASEADKHAALACADAFVSTSQHEGFGLVFLEAMAFGLPVLCYDRGGQTDFLRSDETGFVAPLNDQAQFVRCLKRLHEDRGARVRYGEHNLKLVENYFIDTCARRYEEVFDEVIALRAKTRERKNVAATPT